MGRKKGKNEEFEVEVILKAIRVPADELQAVQVAGKHKKRTGSTSKGAPGWKYLVKWHGYSLNENTWEPEDHLASCDRLVRSFWDHVDPNNKLAGSPIGTELVPEPEWIEQEQTRFKSELSQPSPSDEEVSDNFGDNEGSGPDLDSDDLPLPPRRKFKRVKKRQRPFVDSEDDQDTRPRKEARTKARTPKGKRRADSPSTPSTHAIAATKIPLPHRRQAAPVLMPETPIAQTGPQGISVKQRLTQLAITPATPREFFSTRTALSTPKRSHPKFNVRLKQLSGTPNSQLPPEGATSTISPPATTTIWPSSAQDSASGLVLPTTPIQHDPAPPATLSSTDSPLFSEDEDTHNHIDSEGPPEPIPESMPVVDDFLETVSHQPVELHESIDSICDTVAPPPTPSPTRVAPEPDPLPLVPVQGLPQIPKMWKWKGPLFLGNDKQPACNFHIHSVMELKSKGMRFSTALAGVGSMRFGHAYDKVDVESIMNVFSEPSQIATVDYGGIGGSAYRELCIYLASRKQVLLHPIVLDGTTVGFVAIFSSYVKCFQTVLGDIFASLGPLSCAAVLLTFVLNPEQQRTLYQLPNPIVKLPGDKRADILIEKVKCILAIEPTLLEFLSEACGSRPYGLWPALPPLIPRLEAILETTLLESLLHHVGCPAKNLEEGVRAIFVHTSALKTLGSLPYLNDRRKRIGTHFFLYGPLKFLSMHPVSRVVEIFPSGGVMTFDAQSILEDPVYVLDLVENVDKHFLWVSYILPETLGLVAHLACREEDPLEVYGRGDFPFVWLLSAIEGGQISLMTAPNDSLFDEEWLSLYGKLTSPSSRQALEIGIDAFQRKHGKKGRTENIHDIIREQIHRDMAAMQQQPTIMSNYRRYVGIHGSSPVRVSRAHNWVEWSRPSEFDFLDEWYPKQT